MVLYISYYNDVQKCVREFPGILEKAGQQMILYYTEDGPSISNSILEYISDGRIKVKKLPCALEESYPLLLYDIGIKHEQEPDTEIILWGKTFVEGVYKLLFSYDMKIREKVRFKKIVDFAKKAEGQKKAEGRKKNTEQERGGQREKRMEQQGQPEEQRKETRGEGTDPKKEKSSVETKNTNMYEKASQCFQGFLKEILGEPPSDEDTNNVMLAILDVSDIVQKEEMFERYKESLRKYFSSERRADYYFIKTKSNLEEMKSFMMS